MNKPTLFHEAAEAYRRRLMSEGRLTHDTDLRITRLLRKWCDTPLVDITPTAIQAYVNATFVNRSPGTANRNLATLSAIMAVAADEGLVLTVPKMKRRRDRDAIRTVHLELDEIKPVVEYVREEGGPLAGFIILLLIDTGLRFGEAMRLCWGDLNHDWITVRPNGGKSKDRKVPTSPRLLEYMTVHSVLPTTADKRDTLIIAARWNQKPQAIGRVLNTYLRRACEATGARCGSGIRIHDLRHTFAFLCASAGADLGDIKEMLGHTNIGMTMRYRGFVETRAAAIVRQAMKGTLENDHATKRAQ